MHTWLSVPGATSYRVAFFAFPDGTEPCIWPAPMDVAGTSLAWFHTSMDAPVLWRVQAKFANGDVSNPAVGYYFVDPAPAALAAPVILRPWAGYEMHPIRHSWVAVPGADRYEIQFANAYPNASGLFEECDWGSTTTVSDIAVELTHSSCHLPIYWRIRAGNAAGQRSAWALSYYSVLQLGECPAPVDVGPVTWTACKTLFR